MIYICLRCKRFKMFDRWHDQRSAVRLGVDVSNASHIYCEKCAPIVREEYREESRKRERVIVYCQCGIGMGFQRRFVPPAYVCDRCADMQRHADLEASRTGGRLVEWEQRQAG